MLSPSDICSVDADSALPAGLTLHQAWRQECCRQAKAGAGGVMLGELLALANTTLVNITAAIISSVLPLATTAYTRSTS